MFEPYSRVRGFTLVEAMVALVILSASGMALFSWVNASVVSLRRVEEANARSKATGNVIEFMQSVNPMARPEGAFDFGTYNIRWQAEPSTNVMDGSGYTLGVSNFVLALYDTRVSVLHKDGAAWFDVQLKLVGYKKLRGLLNPLDPLGGVPRP